MKEEFISKKVLLGLINNWVEVDKYYHPDEKVRTIPIGEIKLLVKDCPKAGEDTEYINNKRYDRAYQNGRRDTLRHFARLVDDLSLPEDFTEDSEE